MFQQRTTHLAAEGRAALAVGRAILQAVPHNGAAQRRQDGYHQHP